MSSNLVINGGTAYTQNFDTEINGVYVHPLSNSIKINGGFADMIECPYPIGSYYTQYPIVGLNDPNDMFPFNEEPGCFWEGTTWLERFNGENVFFCTEGQTSWSLRGQDWSNTYLAYVTGMPGIQPDAIRNIAGKFFISSYPFDYTSGVFGAYSYGVQTYNPTYDYDHHSNQKDMQLDSSWNVPTDFLNHPKNRLIKVWKRFA